MLDLQFRIDGAEPQRHAAEPTLLFRLRVSENLRPGAEPTPIFSVALRCQINIEPARRRYTDVERQRLVDLFGTPERWGQTLRPMPWAHVGLVMPSFTGEGEADIPVPCSFDFSLAATRYFSALDEGDLPLCALFSGTLFYESADGALQVAPIPWDREASFRLPASTWQALRDLYYPGTAWLRLRRDAFDELDRFKTRHGLPTLESALERLLAAAEEPISP